jgi:hypothetical protein
MYQLVKLSTKNTIWKSSIIFLMQFGAKGWTCGPHTIGNCIMIQSFLAKHGIPVVCQAPYSPDMAPCDFWLFPKLKWPLKGSHFDSHEDIMRNVTKELRSLPGEAFQKCFQQWKERWAKCVGSQGAYFEGD